MEKEEKAAATAQEGDFSSRLFRFLRRFISAEKPVLLLWSMWGGRVGGEHIPLCDLFSFLLMPANSGPSRWGRRVWGWVDFIWVEVAFSRLNHEEFPLASQTSPRRTSENASASPYSSFSGPGSICNDIFFFWWRREQNISLDAFSAQPRQQRKTKLRSGRENDVKEMKKCDAIFSAKRRLEVAEFMTEQLEEFQVDFLQPAEEQ